MKVNSTILYQNFRFLLFYIFKCIAIVDLKRFHNILILHNLFCSLKVTPQQPEDCFLRAVLRYYVSKVSQKQPPMSQMSLETMSKTVAKQSFSNWTTIFLDNCLNVFLHFFKRKAGAYLFQTSAAR